MSARSRTANLVDIGELTEKEAHDAFQQLRWLSTKGEPVCPRCGCLGHYKLKSRPRWKCRDCAHQFSVTSGTIFASRKLSMKKILFSILDFVNGAKGLSALNLSRDLGCHYLTAFVLEHKLREVMANDVAKEILRGVVEVDGQYFGGYIKPHNLAARRIDLRKKINKNGKEKSLVVARQRKGPARTFVLPHESQASSTIRDIVQPKSVVYTDEGPWWKGLIYFFEILAINHEKAYSLNGVCTNQAESFFSRSRRAEQGIYHHIAHYLASYGAETAWRENHRGISNGEQYMLLGSSALNTKISRQWKGYWQRPAGTKSTEQFMKWGFDDGSRTI